MKKAKLGYRLFKHYVRFLQDHLLFKHRYVEGIEYLPEPGEPYIIPAQHQNAAIDPLIILLSHKQCQHPYVLAMGGVFLLNPLLNKIWDWVGMLPAFRMSEEGVDEAVKRARWVIDFAAEKMHDGEPVIIFPEEKHHMERWMRVWQLGYLNIAFKTAEMFDFQRDVQIVPTAHHYSNFFGLRRDYLVRYSEPISLQPYYEQYKTKPRTTVRELNKMVRERVSKMMLFTEDVEHEPMLEFVRHTHTAKTFTLQHGFKADYLPDQLAADQLLWKQLEQAGAEKVELYARLTELTEEISNEEKRLHLTSHAAEEPASSPLKLSLALLAQLLLLPLWLFAMVPNGLFYYIPPMFMPNKDTDTYALVFTQSMQLIISALALIPLTALISLLVMGLCWGWWWQAIVWIAAWYPMALFAWHEGEWMRKTKDRLILLCKPSARRKLSGLYHELYNTLQELLG